jgi:hypothetical protein
MKQDAVKNIKAQAFDYIFKGLIAVVCFLVKDMREDVKQLMQVVPALQAKVDMITDQRLIDRFKILQVPPAKDEEPITYDSLMKKH